MISYHKLGNITYDNLSEVVCVEVVCVCGWGVWVVCV